MEKSIVTQAGLSQKQKIFDRKAKRHSLNLIILPLLGLILVQGACVPAKKISPKPSQISLNRGQLFPHGEYIHQVNIMPKDAKTRRVKVVVSLSPQAIKLTGLSPLNNTMFKYTEDRLSGKETMDTYVSMPNEIKNELKSFFKILRELLVFQLSSRGENDMNELTVEYDGDGYPIFIEAQDEASKIFLSKYDENKIPRHLEARHTMFSATVNIPRYELTSQRR